MSGGAPPPNTLVLPELGPLLGRLATAPVEQSAALAALDPVRLELLTALFERAGAARALLARGDESGARAALGAAAWLGVWEQAAEGATRSVLAELERRLRDAAQVSRYPAKRLAAELPDQEERRLLAARLSATGVPLEEVAEQVDAAPHAFAEGEALRRLAGELDAAWARLVAAALREIDEGERRAAQVRAWRRPWLPLGVTAGLAALAALWLGLVLGGYLPVPRWLRPLAEWVWSR